jgi:hypothetical protein
MTEVGFHQFYEALRPFDKAVREMHDRAGSRVRGEELLANPLHTIGVAARRLFLYAVAAATETGSHIAPKLTPFFDRIAMRCDLAALECELAVRIPHVSSSAFARRIPHEALRQEFAAYAEKQPHRHIADVINTGISAPSFPLYKPVLRIEAVHTTVPRVSP